MSYIYKILTISLLFICCIGQNCDAYDVINTHQYINRSAAKESIADSRLSNSLGFLNGIKSEDNGKSIQYWFEYGGMMEDIPEARCLRHFHDPLKKSKDWNKAGLLSGLVPCYRSSKYWAQQNPETVNSSSFNNEYSWQFAKDYYSQALLTGSEEYWEKTFRALGQVMHLVSDAAVPAHVRNDPHPFVRPYETWVENNYPKIEKIEYNWFSVNDTIFDKAVSNSSAPSPISALWDHDEYLPDGSNMPDGTNNTIGLAEYTNANFWTEDTIDDYPHPSLEDTDYDENVWSNLELVVAEDGITDHRMYFSKTAGDPVSHFMAAGYWFHHVYDWNTYEVIHSEVIHSTFILDKTCLEDYAEKLIPRAIGYSAALLDYFFRGSMDVRQIKPQGDSQWIS